MRACTTRILPANIILIIIGTLDLATTLWWLRTGRAIEINPIMAVVLKAGIPAFVAVKLSTLVSYVAVMEWYRRHRDAVLARAVGTFTLLAYAAVYAISFVVLNHISLIG